MMHGGGTALEPPSLATSSLPISGKNGNKGQHERGLLSRLLLPGWGTGAAGGKMPSLFRMSAPPTAAAGTASGQQGTSPFSQYGQAGKPKGPGHQADRSL